MSDMIDFWEFLLPAIADFLMSEPIFYFVGMAVLLWTVHIVKRILS